MESHWSYPPSFGMYASRCLVTTGLELLASRTNGDQFTAPQYTKKIPISFGFTRLPWIQTSYSVFLRANVSSLATSITHCSGLARLVWACDGGDAAISRLGVFNICFPRLLLPQWRFAILFLASVLTLELFLEFVHSFETWT